MLQVTTISFSDAVDHKHVINLADLTELEEEVCSVAPVCDPELANIFNAVRQEQNWQQPCNSDEALSLYSKSMDMFNEL